MVCTYFRFLRYVSIILFINKIDLLEEKINSGKSLDMLLDVIPPDNPYNDLFQSFRNFSKAKGTLLHHFDKKVGNDANIRFLLYFLSTFKEVGD